MEGYKKHPQERRDGTPESIAIAHQIVAEELGDKFYLEYGLLPKNVGEEGDVGIYGDTVLICCESRRLLKKFYKRPERIQQVTSRICNESYAVTKVLLDSSLLALNKPRQLAYLFKRLRKQTNRWQ